MAGIQERLDLMEAAIKKPSFRQSSGRANEVNYWVFDYPPESELEVRERVEYLKKKNQKGVDGFELVVFDLYDIIMDYLEKEDFLEQCYRFEKRRGLDRITKAVNNAMKINDDDSYIVQYIRDHTPENAVVFLTGIGKCYPILRSHKVLNNLHQAFVRVPVVMFFPGTYDEQELVLFNEIKDDNYYIATQKPININIVNAISDTTFVSESVCSKHSSLKKGDIAFILLFYSFEFLDYMDFGMYFDCLTDTCLYFNGQLDWLEHNRGYIKERILKKYFNSGNTHH